MRRWNWTGKEKLEIVWDGMNVSGHPKRARAGHLKAHHLKIGNEL